METVSSAPESAGARPVTQPTARTAAAADRRPAPLIARLHDNGQAFIETMRNAGPLILVLDECHHLLEVWGRLLGELLDQLPDAMVLGLTATPPEALTAEQAILVDELFGAPLYRVSIPAVVRVGDLAPYVELAWLTTPTPTEDDWLGRAGVALPGADHPAHRPGVRLAAVPAVAGRAVRGQPDAVAEPGQGVPGPLPSRPPPPPHRACSACRPGARMTEEHRSPPTADDWVLMVDDWLSGHLSKTGVAADEAVVEAVRRALPSVGYQWTKRGIRRGRTPVDRVLARSESKMQGVVQIVGAEHRNLAERLRMLVLCDHERAGATLPADLTGVIDQQAGSAHAMLTALVAAPETAGLSPMLVTGKTVAATDRDADRFLAWLPDRDLAGKLRIEPLEGSTDARPGRRPLGEPGLGRPGDGVLPGRPLPGPRRHPRAARRGLGREADHRARRPHRGHHDHLGRPDPRPGAAHRPALAGEGRGQLVAGLRLRQAPQGRQRLGPAGPQARRLLRHRRRGPDRRRRRPPGPALLAVRAAAGRRLRRGQRAGAGPQRAAGDDPRPVEGGGAVRRHGAVHGPDQGARPAVLRLRPGRARGRAQGGRRRAARHPAARAARQGDDLGGRTGRGDRDGRGCGGRARWCSPAPPWSARPRPSAGCAATSGAARSCCSRPRRRRRWSGSPRRSPTGCSPPA